MLLCRFYERGLTVIPDLTDGQRRVASSTVQAKEKTVTRAV